MTFTLYGNFESGNAYKPALMLALCGSAFEYRHVDIFAGAQHAADFRAISRYGEVPTLVHDGTAVVQSAVILQYLSAHFDRFGGNDTAARRQISEWLFWENNRLVPSLAALRFQLRFVEGVEPAVLDFLEQRSRKALDVLNAALGEQPFLVGTQATIADCACCGYAWFIDQAGLDPQEWPNLQQWLLRLEALPGWAHPYDLMPRDDRRVDAAAA